MGVSWSIRDRDVIITGGNSGIGLASAIALARQGAQVTITARDEERGAAARRRIEEATGGAVDVLPLDLTDRGSIEAFATAFTSSHDDLAVLLNNAGGIFGRRATTGDGIEMTFATNHLGPFLLTYRLLPALTASAPSRVINVASSGHGYAKEGINFADIGYEAGFRMMTVYGQSKLANILHARELERRYGEAGVHGYAMHPGLVRTSIGRDGDSRLAALAWRITSWRQLTPEEGADTAVWLATAPDLPEPRGGYFEARAEARSTRWARNDDQAAKLWELSEDMLGLGADSGSALS